MAGISVISRGACHVPRHGIKLCLMGNFIRNPEFKRCVAQDPEIIGLDEVEVRAMNLSWKRGNIDPRAIAELL